MIDRSFSGFDICSITMMVSEFTFLQPICTEEQSYSTCTIGQSNAKLTCEYLCCSSFLLLNLFFSLKDLHDLAYLRKFLLAVSMGFHETMTAQQLVRPHK